MPHTRSHYTFNYGRLFYQIRIHGRKAKSAERYKISY